MPEREDIDNILNTWPFDSLGQNVRKIDVADRSVLQMRVDMGILQLEVDNRPDGTRPHDFPTYLDYLIAQTVTETGMKLAELQCVEVDREFVQFYHRRVCWLQLKEFRLAVRDADHTLRLMDFCQMHSPSEQWTLSHEQYRPFVLYHRTQASALELLQQDGGPELAIEEINHGLDVLRQLFVDFEAEEQFDDDELVKRLSEFRESLRDRYEIGKTLQEQLAEAVADEHYELAAKLRDRLNNRDRH